MAKPSTTSADRDRIQRGPVAGRPSIEHGPATAVGLAAAGRRSRAGRSPGRRCAIADRAEHDVLPGGLQRCAAARGGRPGTRWRWWSPRRRPTAPRGCRRAPPAPWPPGTAAPGPRSSQSGRCASRPGSTSPPQVAVRPPPTPTTMSMKPTARRRAVRRPSAVGVDPSARRASEGDPTAENDERPRAAAATRHTSLVDQCHHGRKRRDSASSGRSIRRAISRRSSASSSRSMSPNVGADPCW